MLVKSRKSCSLWWGTALLQALSNGSLWRESYLSNIAIGFAHISRSSAKLHASLHKLNWNTGDVNKQTNQKTGEVSAVPPLVILDILRKTKMAEICWDGPCRLPGWGSWQTWEVQPDGENISGKSHSKWKSWENLKLMLQRFSGGYSVCGTMIERVVRCVGCQMCMTLAWICRVILCSVVSWCIFSSSNTRHHFWSFKKSCQVCETPFLICLIWLLTARHFQGRNNESQPQHLGTDPLAGQQLEISVDHLQCVMAACAGFTWGRKFSWQFGTGESSGISRFFGSWLHRFWLVMGDAKIRKWYFGWFYITRKYRNHTKGGWHPIQWWWLKGGCNFWLLEGTWTDTKQELGNLPFWSSTWDKHL